MRTNQAMSKAAGLDGSLNYETFPVLDRHLADPEPSMDKAPPLPSFEFSTEGLPRSDQFDAWRNSFAPMLELTPFDDTATDFRGRQKLWDLGSLIFAQIKTDRLAFASLPGHVRREPVDHWVLTLLQTGTIRTETPRNAFKAAAGDVQVHSLGRDFSGETSRSEMLMLFVPRDFSTETAATLSAAEFSTLATGMGRLFSDYLIGVANRLPTLTMADLPGLAAATRAMILACVSPSADHIEAAEGPIATILLERARQFVQSRLLDPKLECESVRRELGISRTRLYNLFEPFGGVMHYIQHRRLISAYSALSDPNDRRLIFEIAEQRGFSDGAEFSRAFKRAFGYSPSEVRKRGGGGIPNRPARNDEDCPSEERLGLLLRRLQG
ncbi:helix-turn-helix domain-containing protein [Sinorhizobium sp. BG8]|uniref:helix-turn-helix domain-containing protein n=1 Tax=Sinorhizobium sp. BG8 TaxID=2613773 RepID=UPI00193EAD85|nr:helix-turn-helix domain-containing protein [Sinorhizobium sp. BG8]QRM54396.1 helix-turn-helix domain-containing protein [Sinorhizobium sp. BG8]